MICLIMWTSPGLAHLRRTIGIKNPRPHQALLIKTTFCSIFLTLSEVYIAKGIKTAFLAIPGTKYSYTFIETLECIKLSHDSPSCLCRCAKSGFPGCDGGTQGKDKP